MKRLRDCLNKTVGKLVTREDADHLWQSAQALQAGGMTPIQAEQQAVQNAIEQATSNGESILDQIRGQRPAAYSQARNFWEQETIRKPGMPPPLPRFVTEAAYAPRRSATTPAAPVPAEEIVAVHNAGDIRGQHGSTVNAVHGDLIEREVYSVSIFPDLGITSPGKNITVEQINAFAVKAQAAGLDVSSPNLSIGTWWDAETDTTFIDIAFTTTDRAAAIALGQQFNQKAIYDLKVLGEIPTGGTGVAPENLPSIAERIGILFPPGYDVGRHAEPTTSQAEAPAGPPSGSAYGTTTEAGVPGSAGKVQPELGGIQQEAAGAVTPPEIPAAPISDAAQEAVNSLPEEQRNAAQKAFSRDDRDPLADQQRKRGEPVAKRKDKAIAPEKSKLVKELSKYGAFDKTLAEVVRNIANDPQQPRWIRLLADLFIQLGLGEDVNIRAVNAPEASWRALYNGKGENGAEILINLSHAKGPDLARTLLHELMHHGTLVKLDAAAESELTPSALAAKRELQKIFDIARKRMTSVAAEYGARGSLKEFVSEIFSNDALRAQLNAIRPDGKVSLMQRVTDAIRNLLTGDLPIRGGSLLEAAIREALNVAGSPRVEGDPVAAMQEKRSRAARLANDFPGLEEQIADTIAPMAAEHNMGITKEERKPRVTGEMHPSVAFYTDKERALLEPMIDEQAKDPKINATKAEIAEVKKRLEVYIKDVRNQNPPEAGWAHDEIDPRKVVLLRGKKGLLFDTTKLFKDAPYTYTKDDAGKNISRFLKRSKADEAVGKPLVENPEWAKRRAELSDAMYDEMLQQMDRTDPRRDIILEQINWYRDMVAHLRTHFGSMSDYMADVIAGFSPQNAVKENWLDMISYFGGVMSGSYDKIFSEFDAYVREDPENHNASTWKAEKRPMPRKIANDALFGANTANAMMAGLDLWRQVQFESAPKARNFGLNLIGLSVRATIDRWAARFLQRMHNPNWRIPIAIEGEVTGKHMKDVSFVAGDFGMGQDVFADVAKRLQASGMPEFKDVTAADLQAILWFGEKEYWETRSWSPIVGAGSSMKAVAEGTSAQRYEAGFRPDTSPEKKMAAETAKFRAELHKDKNVLGGKVTPTVSVYKGKQQQTIDADWVTKPTYDPTKSVADLARAAVSLNRDAAHISRVILDPNEDNPNATPGLHIFFKGRVSEKEIQPVLDQLKKAGLDGAIFSIDPRVRPEIIKSLDPSVNPNQYSGVRIQHVPAYGTTGEIDSNKLEQILADVANKATKNANIAEARVLYYDTLVLEKGTDYDTKGNITPDASGHRAQAWTERALRAGAEATARRDRARAEIADRQNLANELERRNKAEEQARLDELERAAAAVQPADRAIDGGVDPSTVAAMQYEDEQQPVRDPHGGRESLVRAMVERIRNASRDRGGIEIPESAQEVRGIAGAGGRSRQKGSGSAPIWRSLGASFRKREAALARRLGAASDLISVGKTDEEKEAAKYADSQRLFDYLLGKETPEDPELRDVIAELRKEIPVIPQAVFRKLQHLDVGTEADVYHDPEGGVVYKAYGLHEGKFSGWVPGSLRLREDGEVGVGMAGDPTFAQFIGRMERSNAHGLTPSELIAMTPEGHLVFAQPFVAGRGVTPKNSRAALARAGIHELTQIGGISGVAKLDDGRWVLYDDLHKGNVRTMPGGRIEVIDANNRELDQYEINDLTTLGKMPPEKPPGPPRAKKPTKKAQSYDNAVVVAPMVETHHGTPHDWAAEKRVRFEDGATQWVPMDEDVPPGAVVVERAPAGRVRAEKVASGEGNAAYGWGVLYSAARRELAEWYKKELSGTKGEWLIDNKPINYSEEATDLREALISTDPELALGENIMAYRDEAKYRRSLAERTKTAPIAQVARQLKVKAHLEYADLYERRADALEQYEDRLTYRKSAGNVYTVQLDVNDPELLDWFMPMRDQMFVFDKVAARFGVTQESAMEAYQENERLAEEAEELQQAQRSLVFEKGTISLKSKEYAQLEKEHAEAEERWYKHSKQAATRLGSTLRWIKLDAQRPDPRWTGEKFYTFMTDLMGNSPRAASEYMNLAGVPGIVFIDRESRKKRFSIELRGQEIQTLNFDTREEAEYARAQRQKSFPDLKISEVQEIPAYNNYVMFDPERIKVVAKNGEVVRTVADDLPAPPPENVVEPVTVAAMSAEDVKDDRDLSVAPMAATGRKARKDVSVENYKPAGWTAPFKRLSWEIVKLEQRRRQKGAATTYRIQTMVRDFERKVKKAYKGKLSPEENKRIMLALGNLDNRLTQEQAREARKMTPTEREGFLHTAHMENVARFKVQQEQALNSLPDEIREAINVLREELDLESKEALKDTGLDTELRARLDANQGVFLHSNAFQHFEDDVWGKRIKSDDPKAVQIRRAAEDLFRNEIIGENAHAYQAEQKAKGVEVSDEDALRLAAKSGDLGQQIATRLDDYLNKQADEPSRLHMLMGKMPVTRNDAGKMLSLDRENIPKEIRELWGQYDDPATNFSKTLSILANHNAQTRMQNSMLEDGLENGYFWKQDVSPGPRPPGLVRMSTDTRGPFVGVYGPPELKQGLSLMNQRPVRSLLSELNSVPLMMKTVGSVGSAVRNFFGNPLFMVSNGNLPISAVYWPKAFWLGLQRAADFLATPQGRKQLARMIELGVLDENVDAKILEKIAKNARTGHKWEGQAGFGASVAAIQRTFIKGAEKTMIPFQRVYTMADNFWRLANYNVELLRQKWMNPDLSPEQQEENAAEITRRTLPTYSNIIEGFRESYGKVSEVAAPYLSFQAEAVRTYASSVHLALKEISSGKPKEMLSGSWRLGGLALATSAPFALGMASKAMFGYDDDDEKAIRAGLPEYQRNNMLFFLPRGPNNEPRYLDLNFVNPYSLVHTAITAGWRGAGLGGALKQLAKPIAAPQPFAQLGMDLWNNKDSRGGGGPIYDPYASKGEQAASILKRAGRDWIPGTVDSAVRVGEAYAGRDIMGNRFEKTGEKRDLREEVMKVFPGAADVTFDRDKAMQMHVNEHKTAARNASGLFDKKISADGPVDPGEVGATYKEADERSFRAFQQMRQAYNGLLKLGMTKADAIKQMRIGFGSEIRKGGLSKDVLKEIATGNYQRFEPSKQLLKETAFKDRERDHKRIPEFKKAQEQQPSSRTASP